jgi:hypothetical protein
VGIFTVILYLSAPLSLAKMAISAIQLVAAAENMATIDRHERSQQKATKQQ